MFKGGDKNSIKACKRERAIWCHVKKLVLAVQSGLCRSSVGIEVKVGMCSARFITTQR